MKTDEEIVVETMEFSSDVRAFIKEYAIVHPTKPILLRLVRRYEKTNQRDRVLLRDLFDSYEVTYRSQRQTSRALYTLRMKVREALE
jgi:hypothetical protein